ncbi:MAG: transposase [Elusimicrobia bacterium]|nr:transposase [Candidatus Liberimonas magnetica]
MARPLRIEYPDAWYHVTCRGNEKNDIFRGDKDKYKFLDILKESSKIYKVEVHCYVLMNNHFHFLLNTKEANLNRFMQRFNTAYTTYFNYKNKRIGHLYQGRYKAILIESDKYLLTLSRYIHLNPIKLERYKKLPAEDKIRILFRYKWSSLKGYINLDERDVFVNYSSVLGYTGGDNQKSHKKYYEYILSGIEFNNENIKEQIKGQMLLGSEEFTKRIEEEFIEGKNINKKDFPHINAFCEPILIRDLANVVAGYYGVDVKELLKARSCYQEPRQILIELSYQLNLNKKSLTEIGKELGGITGSAVAHVHKKTVKRMQKEMDFNKKIKNIKKSIVEV